MFKNEFIVIYKQRNKMFQFGENVFGMQSPWQVTHNDPIKKI
jgi:hypothetical protein